MSCKKFIFGPLDGDRVVSLWSWFEVLDRTWRCTVKPHCSNFNLPCDNKEHYFSYSKHWEHNWTTTHFTIKLLFKISSLMYDKWKSCSYFATDGWKYCSYFFSCSFMRELKPIFDAIVWRLLLMQVVLCGTLLTLRVTIFHLQLMWTPPTDLFLSNRISEAQATRTPR